MRERRTRNSQAREAMREATAGAGLFSRALAPVRQRQPRPLQPKHGPCEAVAAHYGGDQASRAGQLSGLLERDLGVVKGKNWWEWVFVGTLAVLHTIQRAGARRQ
jgi:hypothetical protein